MGFIFNGIHSENMGLYYITTSIPILPEKRSETIYPIGCSGSYVYEDGYNNRMIELSAVITAKTVPARREIARKIATWFSQKGTLIFDNDPAVEYQVIKTVSNIQAVFNGATEDFTVQLECEPFLRQTFHNDALTWETAHLPWRATNISWAGFPRVFHITTPGNIRVINAGTYKALPLIRLQGNAANLQIGEFTVQELSGELLIDCKNKLVYSLQNGKKKNEITNTGGVFPELLPGENIFAVSGGIADITIEFDYRNTFL